MNFYDLNLKIKSLDSLFVPYSIQKHSILKGADDIFLKLVRKEFRFKL